MQWVSCWKTTARLYDRWIFNLSHTNKYIIKWLINFLLSYWSKQLKWQVDNISCYTPPSTQGNNNECSHANITALGYCMWSLYRQSLQIVLKIPRILKIYIIHYRLKIKVLTKPDGDIYFHCPKEWNIPLREEMNSGILGKHWGSVNFFNEEVWWNCILISAT